MDVAVKRVVVWFIVLLICVRFVPVYGMLEAAVQFVAAGVIPGTDLAVPPTVMLWLLTQVAILALLLIFRRDIIRALTRRRHKRIQAAASRTLAAQAPSQPAPTPAPAAIDTAAPNPVVIVIPGTQGLVPRYFRAITTLMPHILRRSFTRVILFGRHALYRAHTIARMGLAYVLLATHFMWQGMVTLVGVVARMAQTAAVRYWRLALPYMQEFDRWLELKCKQSEGWIAIVKFGREVRAVLTIWRQEAAHLLQRLTTKI